MSEGLSEADWTRLEALFDNRLEQIETHLRFTDGRVDLLSVSVNGDPLNLKDHPGLINQMGRIVERQGDITKYKVVAIVTSITSAIAIFFQYIASHFHFVADAGEKIKP